MSADDAPTSEQAPPPPDLQFDRVDSGTQGADGVGPPGVACAVCRKPVRGEYYTRTASRSARLSSDAASLVGDTAIAWPTGS